MRGCSLYPIRLGPVISVFPAGAGVFLWIWAGKRKPSRVPRRCGGVPYRQAGGSRIAECSPQVRGCSQCPSVAASRSTVFPAGAGVFLKAGDGSGREQSVPRRCGGVPKCNCGYLFPSPCSPQVRGCSFDLVSVFQSLPVFPAGAGVFLADATQDAIVECVPRRCGGVPSEIALYIANTKCSPQVRGCSVRRG